MFCEDRINAFDAMNSDELPKLINIKDAINFVSTAWGSVTKETIRNCWMKTDILPGGFLDEYLNDDSEPVSVDVIGEIQDLIERLPLDQPMDAEEYVVIDDNVTAREIPTDEEIVSIVKNCESNESDDGDLETEPLSYAQAITFVDGIVTFLEQQPDGDFIVDNSFVRGLSKLKKEIVSKEFASRKQSVLDMFVRKH